MYLTELHGHGTSAWPGSSGAPTEWTALTNDPVRSISRSAGAANFISQRPCSAKFASAAWPHLRNA